MRYGPSLAILLFAPALGMGHPLPSFQFDRAAVVHATSTTIEIRYTLELSLFAMAVDARGLFSPAEEQAIGGRQAEFAKRYAQKKGPLVADAIRASVDGRDVEFRAVGHSLKFEETHAIFEFRLTADRPPGQTLAIEDQSFEDKPGAIRWSVEPSDTLAPREQADDLAGKSPLELTAEQAKRRRNLKADLTAVRVPPSKVDSAPAVPDPEPESLPAALRSRGLVAFFDSTAGLGVLLLAALLFGAAHALTPGHGKTLVAAYLVGERGTFAHAVLLGLSTTLSHTGSVVAVAIGLHWAYRDGVPETVQAVLQIVGGLLILGIGLFLLMQRLRNRADHVHWSGPRAMKPGWGRVVLMGLAGGLVPCWDAVMLLLVAIAAGRLAFALPLLLAFSIGLAGVLVLLGLAVVAAAKAGGKRFGESRWFRMLPVLSAVLLVAVGAWFCRDGWQALAVADAAHANR
jgi:ABC-type nickel/cobalt efflux system permease component RcnA